MACKISTVKQSMGIILLFLSACAPEQDVTRTDEIYGKSLFAQQCATCHGATGTGAEKVINNRKLKAPDLTTLTIRNNGTFPRDYVMGFIDGYDRRNDVSQTMPEFGARGLGHVILVENGGFTTPIPSDLLALTNYLKIIQK